MKFKVGDRVRVTNVAGKPPRRDSMFGMITAIARGNTPLPYLVTLTPRPFDHRKLTYGYAESELELELNGVEYMLELL